MDEFKQAVSGTLKALTKILGTIILPAVIIIIMLASIVYLIFLDEGGYKHYSFDSYGGGSSGGSVSTGTVTDDERSKVDNVRFVIEELVKSISIDSIKESKNNKGGYAFYALNKDKSDLITIDEKIDEILKTYPKVYDAILRNISEDEIYAIEKREGIVDLRSDEEKKDEKARELLKKFITAELKTKYPDLRTEEEIRNKEEIEDGELQGAIKIVRNNSENNLQLQNSGDKLEYIITEDTEILTYMPYGEFQKLNSVDEARKHFSLKASEEDPEVIDIVVYGWEKTIVTTRHTTSDGGDSTDGPHVTYEFYEVKMDYREQIKGKPAIVQGYAYDMPAGFLWSIFLTGESFEFVEKLADLAINETEIVIEAQDNTKVTVETEVTTYTEKQIEVWYEEVREYDEDGVLVKKELVRHENTILITHTITKTVEKEYTSTMLNWVYTETWVQTYKRFYIINKNNQSIPDSWQNTAEKKEIDSVTVEKLPKDATDGTIEDAGIQTNSTVTRNDVYIYVDYEKQERQDIDEEHNFITYFNNSGKNRKLILEVTSWLNDLLRTHEKTAELENLFKYLLYKANGWDYGVTTISFTEYDFEQFESSQMSTGTNCPRYYQNDDRWKNNQYNYTRDDGTLGTIGGGGCGACALAMAASGLTGQAITPDIIVEYLNNLGKNTVTNGTECAQKVAELYGLTYEKISRTDTEAINQALDSGKCLIFSVTANGIYTGEGHYIMCNGRDENGGYYVLESAHYYETDRPYAFDQVFTPGNQGIFVLGK